MVCGVLGGYLLLSVLLLFMRVALMFHVLRLSKSEGNICFSGNHVFT